MQRCKTRVLVWALLIGSFPMAMPSETSRIAVGNPLDATLELEWDRFVDKIHGSMGEPEIGTWLPIDPALKPPYELTGSMWGNLTGSLRTMSFSLPPSIRTGVLARNGRVIALVSRDGTIFLMDSASREILISMNQSESERAAAKPHPLFTSDEKKLLVPLLRGAIGVWTLPEGEFLCALETNGETVVAFAFAADEGRVVAVTENHLIVWTLDTGQRDHIWPLPVEKLDSPDCFLVDEPRERVFFDGGTAKFSWLIDYETGQVVHSFDPKGEPLTWCAALSGDGSRLAVSDGSHRTSIVDAESLKVLRTIEDENTLNLFVVPGEDRMITTSFWGKVTCWDMETGSLIWSRDMDAELHYETGTTGWRSGLLRPDCGITAGGLVMVFWNPENGEVLDGIKDDEMYFLEAVNYEKQFMTYGNSSDQLRVWNIDAMRFRYPKTRPPNAWQ